MPKTIQELVLGVVLIVHGHAWKHVARWVAMQQPNANTEILANSKTRPVRLAQAIDTVKF